MTEPRFNEVIHAPNRLRICAILAAVDRAEFATLRESLGVADSVLSKHLGALVVAGYVVLDKPTGKGRVKTWATMTGAGREAFAGHVAELQQIVTTAELGSSPLSRGE